jgi:hypothetical protein
MTGSGVAGGGMFASDEDELHPRVNAAVRVMAVRLSRMRCRSREDVAGIVALLVSGGAGSASGLPP